MKRSRPQHESALLPDVGPACNLLGRPSSSAPLQSGQLAPPSPAAAAPTTAPTPAAGAAAAAAAAAEAATALAHLARKTDTSDEQLRSCSGGSHNNGQGAAAHNANSENNSLEHRPSSQSLPLNVPRSGTTSASASLSSGDTTQNEQLRNKIRVIQPISGSWCREALATGPDQQQHNHAASQELQAHAGTHGSADTSCHGKRARKGASSGDAGDSGAGVASGSGMPPQVSSRHRSPAKSGEEDMRGPTAAATPHAAGAGAGRPSDQAAHSALPAADQATDMVALHPLRVPPPPARPRALLGLPGGTSHLMAAELAAAGPPAAPGSGGGGGVVLGEVQGQLALLYHWYVNNRNTYLDQTKALVSGLGQLVQEHRGSSPRPSEIDAVNQAVQTALQIIKTSTDLECSWRGAAAAGAETQSIAGGPGEAPSHPHHYALQKACAKS